MSKAHWLTLALAIPYSGCAREHEDLGGRPGVKVNADRAPDLDPRTDHDIEVTPPDIDVDVNEKHGEAPDVDVDILQPRDSDTKANETVDD